MNHLEEARESTKKVKEVIDNKEVAAVSFKISSSMLHGNFDRARDQAISLCKVAGVNTFPFAISKDYEDEKVIDEFLNELGR
ncbi:hypothetical protein DH09_00020 (plasmid) [Bacillaceae bacterium JMAK1]|nr:hypothetical protein DH09_00020 [Bacillaceae bacterium JMAK1]